MLKMVVRTLCYMGVCDVVTRYGKYSQVGYIYFLGNWMRGLVGGLQNRPGPFDSDIALLLCISTQVVEEDSLQNYYVVGSNPA